MDFMTYNWGEEGYLAQSDFIAIGTSTGNVSEQNYRLPSGRDTTMFQFEIDIEETLHTANIIHTAPDKITVMVSGRRPGKRSEPAFSIPPHRRMLLFLVKPDEASNIHFVTLRGPYGRLLDRDTDDAAVHEVFGTASIEQASERVRFLSSQTMTIKTNTADPPSDEEVAFLRKQTSKLVNLNGDSRMGLVLPGLGHGEARFDELIRIGNVHFGRFSRVGRTPAREEFFALDTQPPKGEVHVVLTQRF